MTPLLKKAFNEASQLSELEQNVLAKWLLAELSSEKRWRELFAESEEVLSRLADEALNEHKQGKTQELK
jgi:hypothetical protein